MDLNREQRLIDEEILDHERCVLDLKTRRNTHTHVSRIPNELLADIFAMAKKNVSDVGQWHHFVHVCRHWRCVALMAANLWTSPPTHLHDYALAMLERSLECALTISLDYRTSPSTTTAVLSHVGRVQSLSIVEYNEALNSFQAALLASKQRTSQMEYLRIAHRTYLEEQPIPAFKLLKSTFPSRTALKGLVLNGIDLEWEMFPIQNLTSLSLIFLEMSDPPSWTLFIDTLRGMPLLESLSFSFHSLNLASQPSRNLEPLQMPNLQHIDIHWSAATDLHTFLSYSTYPLLRRAYFECSSSHGLDPHDYAAVGHAVISLVTRGDFGPLNELIVGNDRFMMIKRGGKAKEKRELEFWCPPFLAEPQSTRLAHDAMSAIISLPDNACSNVLHLSLLDDYSSEQLVEFFGKLSVIQSLQAKTSSRAVINSLTATAPSDGEPIASSVLFPNLRKLGLRQNDYTPELLEDLCRCLTSRQQSGAGVTKLNVNWDLTPDEAQRLQQIVGDVRWNTSEDLTGNDE